jgi:tetratricopeptide (TPR) repeat protein
MQWTDIDLLPQIPLDIHLRLQRESVARHSCDPARHARLGDILFQLAKYGDAIVAFEQAETLSPRTFRQFEKLARCYIWLNRSDAACQVCERGNDVIPDCAGLHTVHGIALRALGLETQACAAFLEAVALTCDAFEAATCLLSPLAAGPDGTRLLALCEDLPSAYTNSTVVRGYRAIALSRVGRLDEARNLVDLERYPTRTAFEPPAEFGGIERFNALLAEEILRNPGLRHTSTYGFYRTEQLAILGARAFPALLRFLRGTIEDYIANFAQSGLDVILPPPPPRGFLYYAGNVVRAEEGHHAHLHKFGYISGVYHVSTPPDVVQGNDRSGALVLGNCGLADGYVACWGARDVKPVPGVATLFPSHIFHSVVPTRTEQPRIAIPFDLCVAQVAEKSVSVLSGMEEANNLLV